MQYLQAGLLVLALIALGSILIGAVKNAHRPRKGKYRTSWFQKK